MQHIMTISKNSEHICQTNHDHFKAHKKVIFPFQNWKMEQRQYESHQYDCY